MASLIGLAFYAIFAAIFFCVLYVVIRIAVRDGILAADERRRRRAEVSTPGTDPYAPL